MFRAVWRFVLKILIPGMGLETKVSHLSQIKTSFCFTECKKGHLFVLLPRFIQSFRWFWMINVGHVTPKPANITAFGKRRRQRDHSVIRSQRGNSVLSPQCCSLLSDPGLHVPIWQQRVSETQKLLWTLFQRVYIYIYFLIIIFYCSWLFLYATSAIVSRENKWASKQGRQGSACHSPRSRD